MIATLLRLKEKIMSSLYSQQSKSNIKFHLEPTAFYNTENKTAVHQLFYDLQSKACLGFYMDNQIDATTTINDLLGELNYKHHHKILHTKDGDFVILKQSKLTNLERIKQSMILLEFSLLLDLFKNYLDNFYVHKWDFQDNLTHFMCNHMHGYRYNKETIWEKCDKDFSCFSNSLGKFNTSEDLKHNIRSALDIYVDEKGRNLIEHSKTHHLMYMLMFNENQNNMFHFLNGMRLSSKNSCSVNLLQKQLKRNPKGILEIFDTVYPLFNVLTVNNYGKLKYKAKLELLKSESNMENSSLISEMLDLNDKILDKNYSFLDTLSQNLLEKSNSLYWLDNYHINYSEANSKAVQAVQLNCNDKIQSMTADVEAESATQTSCSLQENGIKKTKKMKIF